MEKEITILPILTALILLVACNQENDIADTDAVRISELEETVAAGQLTIKNLEETIAQNTEYIESESAEFSYLSGLTEAELEAYNTFHEEYDTRYLEDYSPESILLLYYHSVVMGDWETIYELTYNGGSLPELYEFNEVYYTEYNQQDMESILDYRYYDRLEVRNENQSENVVSVEMSVAHGSSRFSTIYDLRKENDIWKMDVW